MRMKLGFNLTAMGLTELPSMQVLFSDGQVVGVTAALLAICSSAGYFYCHRRKLGGIQAAQENSAQQQHRKILICSSNPQLSSGTSCGHQVLCKGRGEQGLEVIRSYNPITSDCDLGYFKLVVKMYPKGRMAHHFREMQIIPLLLKGRFTYSPGQARAFGMLAGGSGITPMFQLIRAILQNPKDKTTIQFIYANTTFEDILLEEDMDDFATKFPDRFKVYYVLSKPPEGWSGGAGCITKEMI